MPAATSPSPAATSPGLRWLRGALACGLAAAAWLWWLESGGSQVAGCGGGGCGELLTGRWSAVLGIPVAAPACVLYAACLAATWVVRRTRDWMWAGAVLLAGAAAWFTGLQVFVLHAFCRWCLLAHAFGVVSALLLVVAARPAGTIRAKALWAGGGAAALLAFLLAQCFGPAPATYRIQMLPELPGPAADEPPRLGPRGQARVLVEYFDYTCAACRTLDTELGSVLRDHPGEFAVLLHPVPLEPSCNPHYRSADRDHAGACELARLALAAWRADPDRFADVHHLLFKKGGLDLPGTRSEVEALVGKARLDAARRDPWVERQLTQNVAAYSRLIERNNRMPKLILAPDRLMHGLARDPAALRRVLREHAGIGADRPPAQ